MGVASCRAERDASSPAVEPEDHHRSALDVARRSKPVSILLVEPRPLVRECFALWLRTSVCGLRVLSVSDAAEVLGNGGPSGGGGVDLILLSIIGAEVKGPAAGAITRLRHVLPGTPIAVLSDQEDTECVAEAIIRRGARGCVPTSLPPSAVIEALHFVLAGGTFVPAGAVVQPTERERQADDGGRPAGAAGAADLSEFTPRELEVLVLLQQGKPNKLIAHELGMQYSTAKVHVRHIKSKLKVTNRIQAAILAQQLVKNRKASVHRDGAEGVPQKDYAT